jgi:hypothetical protein
MHTKHRVTRKEMKNGRALGEGQIYTCTLARCVYLSAARVAGFFLVKQNKTKQGKYTE